MKKFMSLVLSALMIISMMPMSIFATDTATPELPDATVENLGVITVCDEDSDIDSYYVYDLLGGSGLTTEDEPFKLQVAMQFVANDTAEEAEANYYADYTTDFFIEFDGIEGGEFVADGCFLAGYYPSFGEWVKIPLDGFTVEEGVVYPVITAAEFDFKYTDICSTVEEFICGIYFTPEVLVANPELEVTLTLGLSEDMDAALNGDFVTVDDYTYDADEILGLPEATVKNLGNLEVTDDYFVYDMLGTKQLEEVSGTFEMQVAMEFIANDTEEEAAANFFGDYTTDFFIEFDGIEGGEFVADGCYLAGYYGSFGSWVVIPLDGFTVTEGTVYPVITAAGFDFKYTDICADVEDFICGIYFAPEVVAANPDLEVTLTLGLSEDIDAALEGNFITVDDYTYEADDICVIVVAVEKEVVSEIIANNTEADEEVIKEIVADIQTNAALADFVVEDLPKNADLVITLVDMSLTASSTEAVTTITYDVTPVVDGEAVSELDDAITFRLPVPANVDALGAKVTHDGDEMGVFAIEEENGAKFVELSSSSFSPYTVEFTDELPVVEVNGVGYTTFTEAVANIATDGSDTVIKILADINLAESFEFNYGDGDIIFTADKAVTVKQTAVGLDLVFAKGTSANIVIEKNVTFEIYDNSSGMNVYYGPSLTINGTIKGGQNWGCLYTFYGDHLVSETGTLAVGRVQAGFNTLTVEGELDTNYLLIEAGTFIADGATVDAVNVHDSNNGGMRYGASDFYFENGTEVTATTVKLGYADSTLTIDVSSNLTANKILGNGSIIIDAAGYTSGDAFPIVADMSEFTGSVSVVNNDRVTVEKSGNCYVFVEVVPTLNGSGTEADPYVIMTAEDMFLFAENVNDGTYASNCYAVLGADIDLDDEDWTPINKFTGTFDGKGYTVSNVWVAPGGTGFIKQLAEQTENVTGTVKNVTFENVTIVSTSATVGVIADARLGARVDNVKLVGSVTIQGYAYVGGIVGAGFPVISNCTVEAEGTITATYWGAGAILGFASDKGAKAINSTVIGVGDGLEVHGNLGGVGAVTGTPHGAATDGATVKNVVISSTSNYYMGYIDASGTVKNATAENVTVEVNGNEIIGNDAVVKVDNFVYFNLADAFAAIEDGSTVTLLKNVNDTTVKLPTTLKNVTVTAADGVVVKNSTISAADGNSYCYEGLTFDGIVFENSGLLFTGWRNGDETITDLTVTNCEFKNFVDASNNAPVHINKDATEAVNGFTFTNNVIDGVSGSSNSGVYAQVTGEVVVSGNVINNVAFRPYVIQVTTDDGIADNFEVTGNTFSGSAVGRAQGLGNNSDGTDNVTLTVTGNIFKGITDAQQICYWNFNDETTTADLSKNYYDIDIVANPTRIYYNSAAQSVSDLIEKGVYPYYLDEEMTELATAPAIMVTYKDGSVEFFSDILEAVPFKTNYDKVEGATIKLLGDYTGSGIRFCENDMVLDLNGYTYTVNEGTGSNTTRTSALQIRPEVTTKTTIKNGTIAIAPAAEMDETWGSIAYMINNYAAELVMDNVVMDMANMTWSYGTSVCAIVSREGDTVTLTGTTEIKNFDAYVGDSAISNGGAMSFGEDVVINEKISLGAGATLAAPAGLDVVTSAGYSVVYENGVYTSVEDTFVAEVNGVGYATLADAIDAANGETVVLLAPITVAAGEELTIDLKGQTVTYVSDEIGGAMITNKGTLTIDDTVGGGKISYTYTGAPDATYGKGNYTIVNSGTLTVNNGTVENATAPMSHMTSAIDNNSTVGNAVVVINGGKVVNGNYVAIRQFVNSTTLENTVTVNDGEIVGGKRAVWVQLAGSNVANVKKAALNIKGGTLTSNDEVYNLAVYVYSYGDSAANTTVTVTGGTINGNIAINGTATATMAEGAVSVSGGTFNSEYGVFTYADDDAANTISITGGNYKTNYSEQYATDDGYQFATNSEGYYEVEDKVEEVADLLVYTNSMELGSSLTMNFHVNKKSVNESGYTGYVAKITKSYADSDDVVIEVPLEDWVDFGSDYIIPFNGIAAKEMTDEISITIYDAKGNAVSNTFVDTVELFAQYVYSYVYNKNDKAKAMLVDMLNYGAAAQIYFGYNTDKLANASLTDAQKAYATDSITVWEDKFDIDNGSCYSSEGLDLVSVITHRLYFKNVDDAVYATVSYVTHSGESVSYDIDMVDNGATKYVDINTLAVADADTVFTVVVKDANGNAIVTMQNSISSYLMFNMSTNNANLKSLYETINKFATSAYAFFQNN